MERRTDVDLAELVFLLLALGLAGIHLYLGIFAPFMPDERAVQFLLVGLILFVGPLVYLTSYWQPVLYLVGVGLAFYLGILWLLGGMEYLPYGLAAGVVATAFVLLAFYLFIRDASF